MKNVVTPETARKLKEAGFKQPKFEAGQFWYKERYPGGIAAKWVLCVFSELDFIPLDGGNFPTGEAVFVPTATDVLRTLGDDWALDTFKDKWRCWLSWGDSEFIGKSAIAVTVLAWLEKHAK